MIRFYSFSEKWHYYFEREKRILSDCLCDQKFIDIEHIGATSVVLCNTCGTIDLLLSIQSALDFFTIKNVLVIRGYSFIKEKSNSNMFFFIRRDDKKRIVATIRLVEMASVEYNKITIFKCYLKEKNEHAIKYNQFRQTLAVKVNQDYAKYEKGKAAYIESILESYCTPEEKE